MRVRISRANEALLLGLAAAASEREVCGLVFGEAGVVDAVLPVANVASDPTRHFEIDSAAVFDAVRRERDGGPKLLGYFHSHPKGPPIPSATDLRLAASDGKIWLIIGEGRITAWHAASDKFHEIAIEPTGDAPTRG